MSTEPPDPQHPSERNTNDLNEKVHHPYVTKWRSFPQARLKDQIALLAIWVIDLAIKVCTWRPKLVFEFDADLVVNNASTAHDVDSYE